VGAVGSPPFLQHSLDAEASQIPAPTNQANKKDSRTWESFLLAVPVGFEFSSRFMPPLGLSQKSPEFGHFSADHDESK
jgi:hypothetical protein